MKSKKFKISTIGSKRILAQLFKAVHEKLLLSQVTLPTVKELVRRLS